MNSNNKHTELVLLVLSLSLFCAFLGVGIITPLLPIYATKLGVGGPFLGVILGIFSFSRTGTMLFSGELAERFNKKKLLIIGLFVYAISSLGYLLAKNSIELLLVRFIHGFGSALVVPIAMAIGADFAPNKGEGAYLATMQTALFLGVGSGPLLSGILTDYVCWNASFYAMATLTTFALITVIIKLPNQPKKTYSQNENVRFVNPFPQIFKMLSDQTLKAVIPFHFCSAMARGSLLMLIPLLGAGLRMSFFQIGILVALNSLATALFQRPFGKLADKKSKTMIIISGGLISAISFFLLAFTTDFYPLAILSTLFGLGRSVSTPALTALTAIRGKTFGNGRTMGLFNMAFSAGMMTGPVLAGLISQITGTGTTFCVIGILLALSLVMFLPRRV